MKKSGSLVVAFLFASAAFGQGGSWYVGGVGSYRSTGSDADLNPTTNSWTFSPELGTFFNEKWSAGVALGLSGSKSKNDSTDLSSSSGFSPTLYGRRWWKAGDKLSLFTGLDVSFGSGTTTNYLPTETEQESSSFGTNLNVGVAYGLADRWTLVFKFAALGYESEEVGDETTTSFGLVADGNVTSDQFIFVGIYYTFIPPK